MKFVCRYAIVRFAPYVETEEFANVGVVLLCPHAKYFGYKLIDRSIARVTAFFDELDVNVFRNARRDFGKELERIGGLIEHAFAGTNLQGPDLSFAGLAFDELAKPRDSIMYVSEPRTVLANDPAEQLADLFDRYVARTFATTRTYQERVIQKRIAAMLVSADLKRLYKEQDVGDVNYHARFPFVRLEDDEPVRAIKALHLAHEDASRLYDHGWEWVGRIRKLRQNNRLPSAVLFAVKGPEINTGPRYAAFSEVKTELERSEVQVIDDAREREIIQFARAA